jgi:predicted RNA-binding Zn ribbon-like protein
MSRAIDPGAPWTFHIGYGALCLDFANTVSWRGGRQAVDRLPAYREMVRFAQQSKLVSDAGARRLGHEAERRPRAAARALRDAVALREALYRIFAGLAGARRPRPADLAILNSHLPGAHARLRIVTADDRFAWASTGEGAALDGLRWTVARDAAVFLTTADLSRLRTCANPHCRWVFLDTTRNGVRRWCTMAVCGNRSKVRRHRQRARAVRRGRPPGS